MSELASPSFLLISVNKPERLCVAKASPTTSIPTPAEAKIARHQILRELIGSYLNFANQALATEPLKLELRAHQTSWSERAEVFIKGWETKLAELYKEFVAKAKQGGDAKICQQLADLEIIRKYDDPVYGAQFIPAGMHTFNKLLATCAMHMPIWIAAAQAAGETPEPKKVLQSVEALAFRLMTIHHYDLKELSNVLTKFNTDDRDSERRGLFYADSFQIHNNRLDLTLKAIEDIHKEIAKTRGSCPHLFKTSTLGCPAAFAQAENKGDSRSLKILIRNFFSTFLETLGPNLESEVTRHREQA